VERVKELPDYNVGKWVPLRQIAVFGISFSVSPTLILLLCNHEVLAGMHMGSNP
jgi:hypothetical protein